MGGDGDSGVVVFLFFEWEKVLKGMIEMCVFVRCGTFGLEAGEFPVQWRGTSQGDGFWSVVVLYSGGGKAGTVLWNTAVYCSGGDRAKL